MCYCILAESDTYLLVDGLFRINDKNTIQSIQMLILVELSVLYYWYAEFDFYEC